MFVPWMAWLGILDQLYALIIIPLFITQAPICFDIYVPSSGSERSLELLKAQNWCVMEWELVFGQYKMPRCTFSTDQTATLTMSCELPEDGTGLATKHIREAITF
jgi:hypothetical protein